MMGTVVAPALQPNGQIEPGIYFGMPDEVYFGDDSLGSTLLKDLALDPIEFQYERLHGGEKKETMALKWGSAIHCRALEGRASLQARFPVLPDASDYPGVLVTADDLKSHCATIGVKYGKTKADAIAAIRDFDKNTPIWDEILAKFNASIGDRAAIPRTALAEIEQAVKWMQQDKYLAPVMEDGTMVAGASEVSIFYVDNGVRLKARIDHLLAHAVVDLKSFRPVFQERVKRAAVKAIERMRYDLQAAAYIRALKHAEALYTTGRVFNNPYDRSFLDEVFKSVRTGEMKWIWVLIKASGAPQPIVREFNLQSMIFRTAQTHIEHAIESYRQFTAKYGADKEWSPENPVEVLGDEDFAPWSFM